MEIKRMNEVISYALDNRRDLCRTDEERRSFDAIKREMAVDAEFGRKVTYDMIKDID